MAEMQWECKHFNELNTQELYSIMRLRSEVFVVEQNCPYLDADNKDQSCYHLSGIIDGELAAYARLVPKGVSYEGLISIGRFITSSKYRGVGAGKALMPQAIKESFRLFGEQAIKIGAQFYLKKFYSSFGFEQTSEIYDEDGIPHIEMIRRV